MSAITSSVRLVVTLDEHKENIVRLTDSLKKTEAKNSVLSQ